jgi:hypothetical protein
MVMNLEQASNQLVEATNTIRQIIGSDFFNMFINKNMVEIHVTEDYFNQISAGHAVKVKHRGGDLYPWEKRAQVDGITYYAIFKQVDKQEESP